MSFERVKGAEDVQRWRVLLVDAHPIVRVAVRSQLAGEVDLEIAGEASDAREALAIVQSRPIDVVLVDLELDRDWGMDLLLVLARRHPKSRVLVYTAHQDPMLAQRALDLGATGYVVKSDDPRGLAEALRSVARGQLFLGPSIAAQLLRRWTGGAGSVLSERETQIFRMLGTGLETKEIAARLGISVKTVETHRARIREKLGIKSVGELFVRAALFSREDDRPSE